MIGSAAAFAPATVANLGVGFDVLGLAVEGLGDEARVRIERRGSGSATAEVERIEGDDGVGELPATGVNNTAAAAARAVLDDVGVRAHAAIELHKGMPIGSGLGSSAASAVAAAFATNRALGSPLRRAQLLNACIEGERLASGRHADNVAPALLGGLVLVRRTDPVDVIRLPLPAGLWLAVVRPRTQVLTREARAALPKETPMAHAIQQSADLASFVSACYSGDLDLLGRSMCDVLAEPTRIGLIDGAEETLSAMRSAGALGASISGSGPSLFALCRSKETARDAGEAAVGVCGGSYFLSRADVPGARPA